VDGKEVVMNGFRVLAPVLAWSGVVLAGGAAEAQTIIKKRTVTETIEVTGTIPAPQRIAPVDNSKECDRLYVARNTIFKDAGLCFTRAAAIKTFGNAGCQYDRAADLPISQNDRLKVRKIVSQEASLGCGRKL
jgi:YARHG domain